MASKLISNTDVAGRRARRIALTVILGGSVFLLAAKPTVAQPRALGLDVSAWQGNISQTTWNNIHNVENRDFVFIRSSRGGTTGFYNQSDPNNNNGQNTLSQRYDDPYFGQNITRATNVGMYAGSYHYSRPDILSNTGADEADHFIQMAGPWMRPGYLLPVHDLEAGDGVRSDNGMAQFAIDFSDRVQEVMGIRPAIYINGNYANYVVGGALSSLQEQVVEVYPTLWSARWPNQSNPNAIPVQTGNPGDSISWVYGPWDDAPNPTHPWSFWQYASTGRLNSFNNGNSNLDFNVAHGGDEFLKDRLVPALWTTDSDGQWTTLTNWNSGQTATRPVHGPGQSSPVGRWSPPFARLPSINDTVILDRAGAAVAVTLSSGDHEIRKLQVREALNITGGSLTINYVPSADSTPLSAQFSAPVTLDGGALSVHTLQVDATQEFSLGGVLTFDTIHLMPHNTAPATINVIGDLVLHQLNNVTATVNNGSGFGNSGLIDLGGEHRTWQVADGAAATDVAVEVPLVNGALTKSGAGTLALGGLNTYSGDTAVTEGTLRIEAALLADSADVYLSAGATLELNFTGAADVVDSLFINGVSQAVGTWGEIGSEAQFTSPALSGPGFLEVTTFVPPNPADFDQDGDVDGDDLVYWEGEFGVNHAGADFLIWQREFATAGESLASTHAVPEPSTFVVAGLALAACLCRRVRG